MIGKGISFGTIHSYNDLGLILSEVEIPPAEAKESYIDLPGGNGSLDLTEVHGEVKFKDRDGCKFTFTMNPASGLSEAAFEAKKSKVSNALNGKYFEKITLDKDAGYYYQGRCRVDEYLSDKRIRQIVVTARLKPYKLKQNKTVLEYTLSSAEQTVNIVNSRMAVVPEITCTNDNAKVVFGAIEKELSAGTHKILDIRFVEGTNTLKLSGTGTITFSYQEGDL